MQYRAKWMPNLEPVYLTHSKSTIGKGQLHLANDRVSHQFPEDYIGSPGRHRNKLFTSFLTDRDDGNISGQYRGRHPRGVRHRRSPNRKTRGRCARRQRPFGLLRNTLCIPKRANILCTHAEKATVQDYRKDYQPCISNQLCQNRQKTPATPCPNYNYHGQYDYEY